MRSSRKNLSDHGLEMVKRARGVRRVEGCLIPCLTKVNALIIKRMIFVLVSRVTIATDMMGVIVRLK